MQQIRIVAIIAIFFVLGCESQDATCQYVKDPPMNFDFQSTKPNISMNYQCVRVRTESIQLGSLKSIGMSDTRYHHYYGDQYVGYKPEGTRSYRYKVKGLQSYVIVFESSSIYLCDKKTEDPAFCSDGSFVESTREPYAFYKDSSITTNLPLLTKELKLLKCMGVIDWNDDTADSLMTLTDTVGQIQYVNGKVMLDSLYAPGFTSHYLVFRDPGIPELPDSLYTKCGLSVFLRTRIWYIPPMNPELSLSEAQARVDAWIKAHGVRYFNEMTNLAVLMEEVGELARLFARTYGEQSFKESDKAKQIPDEMADILFVLLRLANQTGVDLNAALLQNLEKKTARDAERHKNNPKLS